MNKFLIFYYGTKKKLIKYLTNIWQIIIRFNYSKFFGQYEKKKIIY